jgi:transposase
VSSAAAGPGHVRGPSPEPETRRACPGIVCPASSARHRLPGIVCPASSARHRLPDAAWASLQAKLRTIPHIWKADIAALRRFVEAVVYVLRAGVAWEDLPERFGRPNSVHRRFRRWAREGIRDELFLDGIPTDALETVMLASSACKAQRHATGARGGGEAALGRSRGGLTTKIHAVVDGFGRPLCFLPTPGQAADCRQARALLEGLTFERLIGDRGYDTDELRDWAEGLGAEGLGAEGLGAEGLGAEGLGAEGLGAEGLGAEAAIPAKRNRKVPMPHDRRAYKGRHKVEDLFCRIKGFGRIVLRKCKTSRSYAGFVSLALTLINIQLCP